MIIEERKSDEINLETIDNDLRMERVRQSVGKLGWDHFSRSVRRNLQGKRYTLDASSRLDVLSSLAFMKQHLPIDNHLNLPQKLQIFSDSLGEHCVLTTNSGGFTIKNPDVTIEIGVDGEEITACKIGYFGQPMFDAPDALSLLKESEFNQFRDSVSGILSLLPKDISVNDKNACKDAFRALDQLLIRDAADSSFTAINTSKYGFYSPPTELRPGRLYYLAEPIVIRLAEKEGKNHADSSHLDFLPYIELSFVKHHKSSKLPVFSQNGEWTEFNDANVCICVKFKNGFLFSQQTIRKLGHIVPRSPLVRHYVNFYRYLSRRPESQNNLEMITQFPEESDIQQKYTVDSKKLSKTDDIVAVEMYLSDLRELPKLVETLRSEWMHASLWESMLAMCEAQEGIQKEVKAVEMQLALRRGEFLLQFDTDYGVMNIQITEKSPSNYVVRTISQLTGDSPLPDLDKMLTEKLNKTWSIPSTLTFAVADLHCRLISVLSPPLLKCQSLSSFDSDKRQSYCLPSTSKTLHFSSSEGEHVSEEPKPKKKKRTVIEIGPIIETNQTVFTREKDDEFRGALLTSFGEVDPWIVRTSTIGKTRPQPRPVREHSQLESMDMMSAGLDSENKEKMALRHQQQQEMQRMSALESARMHMKQSIGVAHAVGLASHMPSSAPGPMRHNSYTMGFDPPAPYDPNIPASIQFPDPLAFGKGKPRKPRGKKAAGEDGGVAPGGRGKGGKKGRGAGAVGGGGGGGRKSTAGEMPYGMDPMRPPLQRSYSDFPGNMTPQQIAQYQQYQHMQQMQQSQQYRMQMQQQMAPPRNPQQYVEEDSVVDEECDPPPPPKSLAANTTPRSSVPHPQLGNPMVGYPGMPLQSPNHLPPIPSPLSAPPKPFSPEQQHFGMKMRENAYWKEMDTIDVKPNVALLKQQMAAAAAAAAGPSTSFAPPPQPQVHREDPPKPAEPPKPPSSQLEPPKPAAPPAPTSAPVAKKKLGLEAAISKIRGQQEQAMKQQQMQQQESVESEQTTPKPDLTGAAAGEQSSAPPPLLAPHQVNRARNLNDIFDDEIDDSSPATSDVKPAISALQKALDPSTPSSSSSGPPPPVLTPNLKKEEEEPPVEREKLILKFKIPKNIKPIEERREDRKEDRKERDRDRDREKDRDGDRDRDRDGDRDRDRDRSDKEEKSQRDKEKKERDRERRRQRDRERAESKRSERDKESSSSSSKKRKLDKKEEKDRREPERKKGKSEGKDYSKTKTTSIIPTLSLNFKIPKKNTVEDDKKDEKKEDRKEKEERKDDSVPGPSSSSASESTSSRKEAPPAPISRKESTTASSPAPSLQRKESFTSSSGGPFPPSDHHRDIPKKKPPPPPINQPLGAYPLGPMSGGNRGSGSGGGRKPQMPPPPPMRGPPPEMYRDRAGGMRGFPPSSHYHGGPSGVNKQVASYAQGLPPGMGPPAVKPHGSSNYQASQWVRPPTHRDSHSYHGMPSLGPPQIQREPQPPTQMIPLPRDPPVLRENPRERAPRGDDDGGPDSPEEGTLRIDDE